LSILQGRRAHCSISAASASSTRKLIIVIHQF
jgi:hypothetical protein